jgi:hypothetical protein
MNAELLGIAQIQEAICLPQNKLIKNRTTKICEISGKSPLLQRQFV